MSAGMFMRSIRSFGRNPTASRPPATSTRWISAKPAPSEVQKYTVLTVTALAKDAASKGNCLDRADAEIGAARRDGVGEPHLRPRHHVGRAIEAGEMGGALDQRG
jgi:hypothetical protein